MRPDKIHVFFTGLGDFEGVGVHVDPAYPDAWREEPVADLLRHLKGRGLKILVGVGSKRYEA